MRSALTQGAQAAVASLGKPDGFLGNPKVRIPLPSKLAKADKMLRKLGMGAQSDALITAMNRAEFERLAEVAVLLVADHKQRARRRRLARAFAGKELLRERSHDAPLLRARILRFVYEDMVEPTV